MTISFLKIYSPELDIAELKGEKLDLNRKLSDKYYSVRIKNEKLCVELKDGSGYKDVVAVDYGYYVGVDVGEFGGWVAYCPDNIERKSNIELIL